MFFSSLFWSTAYAQAATPAQPSVYEQFLPIIVIFVVFYFLFMRPQSKARAEQKKMIESLKAGDKVVTNSGILGVVDTIADSVATLEIAPKVKIQVLKSYIQRLDVKENKKKEKTA